MAYLDDLTEARDNAAARLKEVLASAKPSYQIDGQNISWTDYTRMLGEQIRGLNDLISDSANQDDPYEIHSVGVS